MKGIDKKLAAASAARSVSWHLVYGATVDFCVCLAYWHRDLRPVWASSWAAGR